MHEDETERQPYARLEFRIGTSAKFVDHVCVRAELVFPDDSTGPRLATLPAPALPSADAGLPAAAGSGTPRHRQSAPAQQSAISRAATAALLPASASVRRRPASAPGATSTPPASTEIQLVYSVQPPSDRPSSAGALLLRRPESSIGRRAVAQPRQDVADTEPQGSNGKAAGASQSAIQQADEDGRASQASPRTPLQRVQSSPMASPAASQAEAACCPQSPRRLDTNGAQQLPGPRASPAGKENRDDSQTPPPSSQPQARASQSQKGAGETRPAAIGAALPPAHAEPPPGAAEAAMPRQSPAEGSRQPGQRASDSQATQPLEALPSRPSPATPDAPIPSGDGALRGGVQAEHPGAGTADPLQLSATAPTLPKGLAGPPPDAAAAAWPSADIPPPSADDGSGQHAAATAPPKEHSPVKMAAGQQHPAQQLPPQVNRFFAASAQLPAPGRTPAGGITVAAFNAIVPFPWRPSPRLAARAGAAQYGVPAAAPAVAVAAPVVAAADPQSRPPAAERTADVAAGSAEEVVPNARAAAVTLVSDTTHSGVDNKTSSRPQSTGSASGGAAEGSAAEAGEPAEPEPTGDTQTQNEELPGLAPADGSPAEPRAAGPSDPADAAAVADGDDGGGAAPAAWPTDEEVQVHALNRYLLALPRMPCLLTLMHPIPVCL